MDHLTPDWDYRAEVSDREEMGFVSSGKFTNGAEDGFWRISCIVYCNHSTKHC